MCGSRRQWRQFRADVLLMTRVPSVFTYETKLSPPNARQK